MIEKQGEVVTRAEIYVRLWPADAEVDYEANVNTTVKKLRYALGNSSDQPQYIETIPRKGYCLVIAPEFADSPPPQAEPQARAPNARSNGGSMNSASVNSAFWITFGVIGLILTSMLVGAVITKLWIIYFAPPVIGRK